MGERTSSTRADTWPRPPFANAQPAVLSLLAIPVMLRLEGVRMTRKNERGKAVSQPRRHARDAREAALGVL